MAMKICVGRIDKPKEKSIGILEEGFNPIKFFSKFKGRMKLLRFWSKLN
jgi:hypothetical protein